LVGPDTFRRWIVPHAQELIAMSHAAGAKAIQHFHGQVRHLLPDFLEMGADALHTIEAPPVGNCTWHQAWETVGDRMTLVGNVQYDEFRSLTPAQMTERVAEVLDECRGRRLILSPTAGPFDPNPPAQLIENYLAFMKAGWEYR
jgi:uroporphyrinogen-III decarboxylase